jgi:Zn-dependent protease with chaperone function
MKIQQQEKFDALVEKIEQYARQEPAYYRLRVGLLACLGYGYIFFVLLLVCAAIFGLRQIAMVAPSSSVINQNIDTITILLSLGFIRIFWINFPLPQGIELHRKQAPELFYLIDEIRHKLRTPPIHHILLNYEQNAGVLQIPRLGFLGWQRNYLILGLPLMQSLSPEQFHSTLAHELGHLSGNHSRFSGWIYRVRRTWFNLAIRGNSFLFKWFFNWYEPFFNAYSFVLARADEYEADRYATEITGVKNTGDKLINLYIHDNYLHQIFWKKIYKKAHHRPEPPEGTITRMMCLLPKRINPQDALKWITLALFQKTDNDDTHPCLAQRLHAIGYEVKLNQLPIAIQQTAAEYFLGTQLSSFATQLDKMWQKDVAIFWKKLYNRHQNYRKQLNLLETKYISYSLTIEEAWKRADLTEKVSGNEPAIPLLIQLLSIQPRHPRANYQLGRILLEKYDGRGINYLKTAIALDPDLVIPSCDLLFGFYKRLGVPEEAELYLQCRVQHYEVWQRSQLERNVLCHDDLFITPDLLEMEMQQLGIQLSSYPEIKTAYLVRKQMTVFPEKPYYVLGIVRRFVSGNGANYKHDDELVDQIEAEINLSAPVHTFVFNQNNAKICHAVRRVPGSCLVNN